ncbi:MAG: FHA domain-containing protein [Chloroflexia bacterium]
MKQVKTRFRTAAANRHSAISARTVILPALVAFLISLTWTPYGQGATGPALASGQTLSAPHANSFSPSNQLVVAWHAAPSLANTRYSVLGTRYSAVLSPPGQAADATPTAAGGGQAPGSVPTSANGPQPVATNGGGANPSPVATGSASGTTQQPGTTSSSSGGDFPWLIVLVLAVIVLAGLGFAAMRQRRTPAVAAVESPEAANLRRKSDITGAMESSQTVTTGDGMQTPPAAPEPPVTPTDALPEPSAAPASQDVVAGEAAPIVAAAALDEATAAPAEPAADTVAEASATPEPAGAPAPDVLAPDAPADSTTPTPAAAPPAPEAPVTPPYAVPAVASAAASGMPATVQCANCGSANSTSEKFCHECGQDLRPQVAALAAAAAAPPPPIDVVEADTPYLETLDRVDEQLEFVLSRPRIVIGTAGGNDIVIDAAFKGWRTVSPVHAELRRDQDGFTLVDRDSEYGTFVNEMRTGENILSDGDLVRLGDVRFIFRVPRV